MSSKGIYEKELLRCKSMIDNVRRLGFDVSGFSSEIDRIDNLYKHSKINNIVNFSYQTKANYKSGLKDIINLESTLSKYEVLFNVKNSVMYLNTFLENDVSEDRVLKSADEIIKSLSIFETIDSDLGEEMSSIKSSLVNIAYNVIKLEFINNSHSKVLDFILNDKFYLLDINELVFNEIDNLINSINFIEGVSDLKSVFYDTKSLDAIYVNDVIFELLVLCTNREEIKNKIQENINYIKSNIEKNLEEIEKKNKNRLFKENDIYDKNNEIKEKYRELQKKIISLVLSGSIFIGSSIMYSRIVKNQVTTEKYLTSGVTITKDLGQVPISEEYLGKYESDYQIILEVNNVLRKGENGQYFVMNEKYDVTGVISKEEVYACPSLDIDSNNLKKLDSYEVARMSSITDEIKELYKPSYSYTLYEQDLNNKNVEFDRNFYVVMLGFYFFLALLTFIFLLLVGIFNRNGIFIKQLGEYIKLLKENRLNKEELNGLIEEINSLIYENGNLREEFLSIPDDRKKLLDDYMNVLDEVNSLLNKSNSYKLCLEKRDLEW